VVVKQIEAAGGSVEVPGDSILFVFVRPLGNDNGPLLLAIRMQVSKLPAKLKLTEAEAQPGDTESATQFKSCPNRIRQNHNRQSHCLIGAVLQNLTCTGVLSVSADQSHTP
jgi:hypothetical protein